VTAAVVALSFARLLSRAHLLRLALRAVAGLRLLLPRGVPRLRLPLVLLGARLLAALGSRV